MFSLGDIEHFAVDGNQNSSIAIGAVEFAQLLDREISFFHFRQLLVFLLFHRRFVTLHEYFHQQIRYDGHQTSVQQHFRPEAHAVHIVQTVRAAVGHFVADVRRHLDRRKKRAYEEKNEQQ